jgi:HTH-type transcriptional regulator/antitoxin HigA
MDPRVYRAMAAGLRSHIEDLESQLREYEELKAGVQELPMKSFADLSRLLIAARIARGFSQKDLAKRLGIKPQQVQKDEKTDYRSASLRRILDVIEALNLGVDASVELTKGHEPQ